ncbi:MAG: hypothetical protein JNL57_12955 [Bacteroidetes bacterium]|nr:hypothetical protein [Bacteroidota bacterium]
MKRGGILLGLFASWGVAFSQSGWNPRDSFRRAMSNVPPGLRLSFDGRNSFLSGRPIAIKGARFGFDYGKVALFTGIYTTQLSKTDNSDTQSFNYNYQSSTIEYYVHQSYRFEVVTSFQLGLGKSVHYHNRKKIEDKWIFPAEFGVGGTVRFLRYLGFCAGMGIRVSAVNGTQFTGPYYSYGFTMFTGTLARDLKKLFR